MYHGPFPDGSSSTKWDTFEDPDSWSEPAVRFGPQYYFSPKGIDLAKKTFVSVYKPHDPAEDDWKDKLCFGLLTEGFDGPDNLHYDGKVADAAIAKIRENKDRPFFIGAGFIKPHSPWVCPKKYFDMYDRDSLPLSANPDFPSGTPSIAGHSSSEPRRYPPAPRSGPYSEEVARELRHGYFACVSFIDAQVGRMMDELEILGLREKTIVVLWGDHGYHLGDQSLWGKLTNFEIGTRVPMIISVPGMKAAGQRSDALVELLDLYPTLSELAGLSIPADVQGNSFAPLIDQPDQTWKPAAYSIMYRGKNLGHSVRTDTHRYTEWRAGEKVVERELYDHTADPLETRNVLDDPKHAKPMQFCIKQLDAKHVREPGAPLLPVANVEGHKGSFELVKAGAFNRLLTAAGELERTAGKAEIDDKHAKHGKKCLHLLGGEKTEVIWTPLTQEPGALHFWAERWTSRAPFSFRIDAEVGGKWKEIYNGDKSVRVGRAFLSEVSVPLPEQMTRLRFRCSSPDKTGILIDELSIQPAKKMKLVSASCRQVITPVLLGKENSPVLELNVETEGMLEPLKLDGAGFVYTGTLPLSDIATIRLLGRDGEVISETTPKEKVLLTTKHLLGSETSRFRLAVTLKDSADWSKTVDFALQALSVGGSVIRGVESTDPAGASRIGVALRTRGQDGITSYRIPGIATTSKGTIVAVYDNRNRSGGDLPGDIDVGMSRSTDGGRTWEDMKVIMDMGNDPKWRYDGVGDPTILVDTNSDTLWVLATWSHGNRSWHGSGPGLTPEETGQLMLVKSEDDGKTWSKERNLTKELKDPSWNFLLQGPGNGITLEDGTLVMPAQYKDGEAMPFSTIVYSKDQGKTWKIGTGVKSNTTESQVAQLANGDIMINCRDNRRGSRSVYTTSDLGATWTVHPTSRSALPEPTCNAGLLRIDQQLYFSNPPQTRGRHNITVKVSDDMGMTWPESMHNLIDEFHGAYSVMTPIDDEHIGLLYEGPGELYFVRLPIAELRKKKVVRKSKPNILFIVSEDNGPELGCYGDPYVQTPVLDQLAARGTLFENAHVPYSVCSPSRAVFLTGLYPQQNGHLGLATHKFALYEKTPTIFSHLQAAGYHTGLIGKLHVNPESNFSPHIDFRAIKGANFGTRNMKSYAEAAAACFAEAGDKPFFLSINYPDAHYPLHRQQFGLPEKPLDGEDVKPLPWIGGDSPRLREYTANYYNCMSRLDSGVGMLLEELEKTGERENTLVIYIGDHGAQFSRGKCSVYEAGTRIPFIVDGLEGALAGQRRSELVSTVDLMPTMLAAAGVKVPTMLPGRDLTPLMNGGIPQWRGFLSHVTTGSSPGLSYTQFSIRDARWKLIYNPRGQGENRFARAYLEQANPHFSGGTRAAEITHPKVYETFLNPPEWELYDLQEDPYEFADLAEQAEHAEELARLKKALANWQKVHGDPMMEPENVDFFVKEQADAIQINYRGNKNHRWQYLDRFKDWREKNGLK